MSKTEDLEYGGQADMQKFGQLGNKLMMVQGLADVLVPPYLARDLWERAAAMIGPEKLSIFFRFFEVPGGYHSTGGPGADPFNELAVISAWVEKGEAPDMVVASHLASNGSIAFIRPLFPYPLMRCIAERANQMTQRTLYLWILQLPIGS